LIEGELVYLLHTCVGIDGFIEYNLGQKGFGILDNLSLVLEKLKLSRGNT
jgi:hypothetical protein